MLRFLLVAAMAGAAPATATELVVNGSFSAGNTGFSSDYAYHVGQGHGVYDLAATPLSADDAYPDWGTYGDHTTGTGTMLVADGSTTAGQNVWAESLMLTAGQTYTYSFWGRQNDASSGSNPSLAFLVGGIATGTPLAVSSGVSRRLAAGDRNLYRQRRRHDHGRNPRSEHERTIQRLLARRH